MPARGSATEAPRKTDKSVKFVSTKPRVALPSLDKRDAPLSPKVNPVRLAAVTALRQEVPGVQVEFDPISGAPSYVQSTGRFLSPSLAPGQSARLAVEQFVDRHADLFGHNSDALRKAPVTRNDVTQHSGMTTLVWNQAVNGIPVFKTIFKANVTKAGEVITLADHFLGQPEANIVQPVVMVNEAISRAAASVNDQVQAAQVQSTTAAEGTERMQRFTAPGQSDTTAQLTYLPMDQRNVRLGWDVTTFSLAQNEMFRMVVDAENGEVLYRTSLTNDATDATFRVYADATSKVPLESPAPLKPVNAVPGSLQGVEVPRSLITLQSVNATASPNGWINDGGQETLGNNVDAHTDFDASANSPDLPRPNGGVSRTFDFAVDLTQAPSAYANASVTHLFYMNNWVHDQLYSLGFTESSGNFQTNNFGRGGSGNDAVLADAQDGSGTNNANMSTPADGSAPRMQMYVFTGPTPDRDGDFDNVIVIHEYVHGLSNRLVGGGVGMSALASRGMGEGWSDFYGMALLTGPDADPNAVYAGGSYATLLFTAGMTNNYYYGIRRYPYSTDMLKNPLTFKDIDPTQASSHTGIPLSPLFGSSNSNPSEVHNAGEVWCMMLWECRAKLVGKHGGAEGGQRILQYVTDGMKLSPVNPNFLQSRDSVIQAATVSHPEDVGELWAAFAKRGAGSGATAPASSSTTGVVESYAVPNGLQVDDLSGWTITGSKGGSFTPASKTLTLSNTSGSPISWTASSTATWLNLSPASGTVAVGGTQVVTVTTQASTLISGFYSTNIVFTNSTAGFNIPIAVRLDVTPPVQQSFALNTDPGWTRTGEWAFGAPTGGGGSSGGGAGNADPSAGATGSNVFGVNLSGNQSTTVGGPFYLTMGPVDLSVYKNTRLRFKRWLNTNSLANTRSTVEVSTDGTSWREVFVNPASAITDNAWQSQDYDLTQVADLNSTVYIRWGYRVLAGTTAYSGWNIDDVEILGEPTNALVITATDAATEGDGPVTATLSVTQLQPTDTVVTLTSSDPSAATVPVTVTIPSGTPSTTFAITPVDDAVADGPQFTTITASAGGVPADASKLFTVQDNESGTLTISLPASVSEGGANGQGTVTRSDVNASPLTVTLVSGNPGELTVPGTVVIPGGQASANFVVAAVNDTRIDGTQNVSVTASVIGWTGAIASMDVLDNEALILAVTLSTSVTEGGTGTGSVALTGTLTSPLVVNLSSNSPKLTVPATVTIPAGSTSASFTATAPNDALAEANTTALVTASTAGFTDGSATTSVIDNDLHHFAFGAIASPKTLGSPFSITITAHNVSNGTVTGFTGTAGLSGTGTSGAITMTPTTTTAFTSGVWSGNITISTATTNIVLTASDGAGRTGTSNAFTVSVGALHHFAFGNVTSPKTAGTAFSTTITAQDVANNTVTSFVSTATLSGFRLAPATSSIVISEVNPNTPDEVEFMNVGTGSVDVSGWQIYLYDNVSLSSPLPVFTIPSGTVCAAGQVFRLQELGTSPGVFPTFYYGSNLDWTSTFGSRTAVLLRNSAGVAVDFVCANASTSTGITSPQTIPTTLWSGASVPAPANGAHGYLRIGSFDNSSASDWTAATSSVGTANTGLTTPFNTLVALGLTPATSGSFSAGVWTGSVTVNQAANLVLMRAANGTSTGDSNTFSVTSTVAANAQSVGVPTNTATAITLTGQDSAAPGATLTYAVVTTPTNGTLSGTAPNLTYTPTTGFTGSDSFTFTAANGAITSSAATVTITVATGQEIAVEQPAGNGLADGVSTVDYGTIPSGIATVKTFTVRNMGALDLVVSNITKDGTNSSEITLGSISSSTIASGASATFTVTWTPAAAGARSAAIHILSNDLDEGSFDIALTATGTSSIPDIALEYPSGTVRPDSAAIIDFGTTTLNTPVVRTLTIRNTGSADLTLSGSTIDGVAANQFSIGPPSALTIAPASTVTVDVTFVATTSGVKYAALHMSSNDPDESPYDIELHGIGTIAVGPVTLTKDVNTTPNGGTVTNFTAGTGVSYYHYNFGIYRTDGTTVTQISSSFNVGSTAAGTLAMLGSTLLFTGTDTTAGAELWSYNGTTVARLVDINAGTAASTPGNMTVVGSNVFFTATTAAAGLELWKTDGTAGGTVMVKDILAGATGSSISGLTNVGGTLFFAANDGTNGVELWKSDGTTAGTVMVANINTVAAANSNPANLTAIGSTVYFSATNGTTGIELYKSDGTTTSIVLDINTGSGSSSPTALFNWSGTLYFRATTTTAGAELWKSDGTSGGTALVKDIFAGVTGSNPTGFTVLGSALYFSAADSTANGVELWKTDGTAVGTVMVKDVNAIASSSSSPSLLTVNGTTLYFYANDGAAGSELWKSDGTNAGTVRVEDINLGTGSAGLSAMASLGSAVLFGANDGVMGTELWRSDGTAAGTYRVSDFTSGNTSGSISNLTAFGSALFYAASDGLNGTELWNSDGTNVGTVMVKDIHTTAGISSFPANFAIVNGTLFLSAADATNGTELWKSDGTTAGTVLVANINAGATSSSPTLLRAVGNTLFFAATDTTTNGQELWKSDGTTTTMVKNINPTANASSSISTPVAVGSLLYFSANDGTNGAELWKSDGTDPGTVLVKNINPSASTGSSITSITPVGSLVFFSASDGTNGQELWVSDGTTAGTALVKDINPGSVNSSPVNLVSYNGALYFAASDGVNGTELWRSDGTSAGTVMVKDILIGAGASSPANFREHNGLLYFAAGDSFGTELWRTDGTANGTVLVKDINPGSPSSVPTSLASAGGYLYFAATTAINGIELWRTDGTINGTQLVSDIVAGTTSSSPGALTVAGSRLFFTASISGIGTELCSYDLGSLPELALFEGTDATGTERQDNVGSYDFGSQSSATVRSFTIKNTGAGYLFVNDIAVTGAQSGAFVVLNKPDSSLAIQPGATHTFTVTATLEGPVNQSAVVSIVCNDSDESSFDVPVTVTVLDNIAPTISAPETYLIGQPGQLAMSLPDVRGMVAYTDNRPGDGTITQDPIPGSIVLAIGETAVVTFTATDSAGNVSNTVTTTVQMGLGQPNTGNNAWARYGGGIGAEGTVSRVVGTSDGGAVVAGSFGSSPFTLGAGADQVTLTSTGANDVFVAKFARDGTLQWARSGGGTVTDAVAGLVELGDGSIVVAGTFSASATFSGTTVTGSGNTDSFVLRYLADGTLSWAKGWGGTGADAVTQLVKLADGNLAIAGSYSSTATITLVAGVTLANIGTAFTDLFLIKYQAANGTAVWARSLGSNVTSESTSGLSLAATPDGGVALVGGALSATLSISGSSTTVVNTGTAGTADWFASKFDASGALVWARNVGGSSVATSETPSALQVFSNGDLAIAGTFSTSPTTFGVGSASPQTFTTLGSTDVAIVRLSGTDGLQQWAKRAGGLGADFVNALLVLPDNSLALAGTYSNGAMQLGIGETRQTTLAAPTTINKLYLALLGGGDGSLRWAKTAGGLATNAVSGLTILGGGDLGIAGTFTSPTEIFGPGEAMETTLTNIGAFGSSDVYVAKYARADGDLIWAKSGGGANTEAVHAFTALTNGSAMLVGTFQPPSATFGLGEPGEVTLNNADPSGTNTDFFFARFHGGGVEAPVAPLVTLLAPSGLSSSTLTFNAAIDSRGQDTTLFVEYGPTTSYGSTGTMSPVFAGLITETRAFTLTGLAPLTTLHFRVSATNAAGTTISADQTITTFADAEIVVEQPAGTSLTDGAATVSFGTVAIGSFDTRTFTIRNTGTVGTLSGLALSKDGAAAADYALGTLSVTSLAPGDSTTFTVTYTPSLGSTRNAALHLGSNDGDENPFDIALTGNNLLPVTFASASTVPITANGYTVPTGRSLGLTLGFAPAPGTSLRVIDNTSANPISGTFVDLPQNGLIQASFGGQIYTFQATYTGGDGNDLVLIETAEWTFLKGNTTTTTTSNYGTQGVASATNLPPGRSLAMTWTGADGTLWLFGGLNSGAFQMNDLWKYDRATGNWTWIKGSNVASAPGVYGTLGVGATANTPGARYGGATWVDATGKLWLFGGNGYITTTTGALADLWNYDPATNYWTWVGGNSTTLNVNGIYGTQGTGSTSNLPGARYQSVSWIDGSGNLWLFGGTGFPATGSVGSLNDLWRYEPSTGNWTWMKGVNTTSNSGTYGTKGTPATANTPGARFGAVAWTDPLGRLWLFGGTGFSPGLSGFSLGDLWRYDPVANQWTWMAGSAVSGSFNGSFGTKGVAAVSNSPSYRTLSAGWTDNFGRLWLFGGSGYGALGATTSDLNDLWVYDIANNLWTWIKGPSTQQTNGVYGTAGVTAVTSMPGSRNSANAFTANGPMDDPWLFGGFAYPSNGTASVRSNDLWNLDLPNASTATTLAATAITSGGATLNASIAANLISTSVRFRYGTSPTLTGGALSSTQSLGSTSSVTNTNVTISGLNYSTTYYFRAETTNDVGTGTGAILSFTTAAAPDIAVEEPVGTILIDGTATINVGSAGVAANASKTITLKNTGTAALTISGALIDGTHAGDFAIGTLPSSLAAATSTTFTLTLTPSATGARSAVLHVTSNDPEESPFDVNLTGTGLTPYQAVQQGAGINGSADPQGDADGDGVANVMEIAFGTSPGSNTSGTGALHYTGSLAGGGVIVSTGQPVTDLEPAPDTVDHWAIFVRRKDAAVLGITYTVEFSADLTTWEPSTVTPTVLASDATYEVVSVPYPYFVGGKKARFFRVVIGVTP
ncbi:MAG: M36 family metallopeptidase [Verrucomicrobiaceae bacterium]|nr:M36 family metallopeptidase [Verrucomicrobiaceae bacterium]